ncbi:hydrogenase maturation nickel metallochaperone HypA [Desulfomonile tiedjei]|uniref:Hydrogenase maturation factor HypA n=1 Tax=Desulfomonile tiedjei (strain ATCC 49306 / DSM 6799 / DCB-1) TaxID=706587 RepID=I4C6S6_DESTA|nr:hydrogenase maturation nickel metallochaperone HypA [Desulfomonile tiedjei]AFM25267.1 Hydrogenase-3 nickel incorporation protein HypA [Desulfomonile tiedjei DSM 6799]
MHEMAIVQSIMEILEQQATLHNAKKIVRVSLEFGALTGVMPASIEFGFEVLSKGGIAEGAALDIHIIPIKLYCFDCKKEVTLEDYQPMCPVCSSTSVHIIQGRDEMRIASLEIEDGSS